jgi:adenosylcobyric acid synthase
MLGRLVDDPDGIEGPPGTTEGLGLLDVETVMTPEKHLTWTTGRHVGTGQVVEGYEIHIGRTTGPDCARPVVEIAEHPDPRPEGARSADGLIEGLYLHGLFSADAFRTAWLLDFGITAEFAYGAAVEATLDALADHLESHADIDGLLDIARAG